MAINAEVSRNTNENSMGVLRRFTRRVQETGVLPRVRSIRYAERTESDYTRRKNKLKQLGRRAALQKQIKLGKVQPRS
jgi:ribosomal protein S21